MKDSIGVGIVGYGAMYSMGKHHCSQVLTTSGMDLRAIFDILPERRDAAKAEQPNALVYGTYDQLLADEAVDLVVLVTPHHTHCPLSVQASRARKHVMTEKVMCLNTAEANEMIAAASEAGKLLTVYQNRRWDGDFLTVQKVIQSGVLGDIFQIESSVNGYYFPDGWRGVKRFGGGMLYDWGAHLCDQICTLLRPAKAASVFAVSHSGAHDVDIETQTTATISFDSGVTAEIDVGCMSYLQRPRWLIRGTNGALLMSDWHAATVKTANGEETVQVEDSTWHSIYQNVADHLNKGAELIVKPNDVAESIAMIDAAFQSASTGETIRINR